eukprot:scaffold29265_cov101-Isochrysis_galbana.AAC.2
MPYTWSSGMVTILVQRHGQNLGPAASSRFTLLPPKAPGAHLLTDAAVQIVQLKLGALIRLVVQRAQEVQHLEQWVGRSQSEHVHPEPPESPPLLSPRP